MSMAMIVMGLAATVLLSGWHVVLRHRRRTAGDAALRQSIEAAALIQKLLSALQQHRGMSSAYLSGDRSFERRLADRQRSIATLLGELLRIADRESQLPWPCFTRHEANLFRHHWNELVEQLSTFTTENCVARHTRLIAQVIDWLAAYGEARIRLARPALDENLARNYTERLPLLAECMGQARALGSATAARGSCTPVMRVRLAFLATRAEGLLKMATAGVSGRALDTARTACVRLVDSVRNELLQPAVVTLPAASYFELATAAIDALYACMEDCGAKLLNQAEAGKSAAPTADAIYSTRLPSG